MNFRAVGRGCNQVRNSPRHQTRVAKVILGAACHARTAGTESSRGSDILQYAHPEGVSGALGHNREQDRQNHLLSQALYPPGQGEIKCKHVINVKQLKINIKKQANHFRLC